MGDPEAGMPKRVRRTTELEMAAEAASLALKTIKAFMADRQSTITTKDLRAAQKTVNAWLRLQRHDIAAAKAVLGGFGAIQAAAKASHRLAKLQARLQKRAEKGDT